MIDSSGGGAPAMGMDGPTGDVANPARCDNIGVHRRTNSGLLDDQLCDGYAAELNEYCRGQGGWYVLTAGWCPACSQFIPSVLDVLKIQPS